MSVFAQVPSDPLQEPLRENLSQPCERGSAEPVTAAHSGGLSGSGLDAGFGWNDGGGTPPMREVGEVQRAGRAVTRVPLRLANPCAKSACACNAIPGVPDGRHQHYNPYRRGARRGDLRAIVLYIAPDNPTAARALVARVREYVQLLADL